MVTVEVLTGAPGIGKSTQMMQDMADNPGRYLWAAPIIDLIDEQVPRLRELAPNADVLALHSGKKLKGGVGRNIADLPSQYGTGRHVGAFVTHEALLGTDPSTFQDWHVRIDETPNGVAAGILKVTHSVELLRSLYDLEPVPESDWARVVPKNRSLNWRNLNQDDFAKQLENFHSKASHARGVIVSLNDWNDARNRNGVEWLSIWTPAELAACASVTLTGAGYFNSLAYRVTEACFRDQVQHLKIPARNSLRTGQPKVHIHYFTRGHRGTTTFWGTSLGRWCLVQVCDWLVANVPDLGFWSGNEVVQHLLEHRVRGQMVAPKLAGLNGLREHRSCAFVYSSKSVPSDEPLKSVFGLSDDDIIAARETEDIVQFVFRGAIRNPGYDGPYDIYLYSRDQAEAVAVAMAGYGLCDVEIIPIADSAIMDTAVARTRRVIDPDVGDKLEKKLAQGRVRSQSYRARKKARQTA